MPMNMFKNIKINAILVGIVIAYVMNFVVSIVLFSAYETVISDDITAKKIIFIILSLVIQSSIPAYIAAIVAKHRIIIHSIFLGTFFVLMNLIGSLFEDVSIGFWWNMLFCSGVFLFALLGGIIRKIEVKHLLKREITNSI
jgi:hypothetical protein